MSSTVKPQTLGRRPEDGQDRSVMLSRLGIAEAPQDAVYSEPEPEPTPPVEALAAPPPAAEPAPDAVATPALDRLRAWVKAANDEQTVLAPEEPAALAIPAPPPPIAPPPPAVEEEDPIEAIRQKYRNPPKPQGLAVLNSAIPLPTSLPNLPKVKIASVGERRRKGGELNTVRKLIWALTWLAAGAVGWALLTADANSPIIKLLGKVLP